MSYDIHVNWNVFEDMCTMDSNLQDFMINKGIFEFSSDTNCFVNESSNPYKTKFVLVEILNCTWKLRWKFFCKKMWHMLSWFNMI